MQVHLVDVVTEGGVLTQYEHNDLAAAAGHPQSGSSASAADEVQAVRRPEWPNPEGE